MDADGIIARLGLQPHPEGGHYRQTFQDARKGNERAASTAIYYLLKQGEMSAWHRIDAAECWHYYAGASLDLRIAEDGKPPTSHRLGADILAGEYPQVVVPPGAWQSAQSTGDWTLVGCTVAPGFEFEFFELAPDGWAPGEGN